jgi:phosphatidylinositol glycan class N
MARLGRTGFLTLAVVFHLIYAYSIFDIYFVSPIVSGMRPFRVEREPGSEAPAKRLVLFVADGLRADKAFELTPDPDLPEESNGDDLTLLSFDPAYCPTVHSEFPILESRQNHGLVMLP